MVDLTVVRNRNHPHAGSAGYRYNAKVFPSGAASLVNQSGKRRVAGVRLAKNLARAIGLVNLSLGMYLLVLCISALLANARGLALVCSFCGLTFVVAGKGFLFVGNSDEPEVFVVFKALVASLTSFMLGGVLIWLHPRVKKSLFIFLRTVPESAQLLFPEESAAIWIGQFCIGLGVANLFGAVIKMMVFRERKTISDVLFSILGSALVAAAFIAVLFVIGLAQNNGFGLNFRSLSLVVLGIPGRYPEMLERLGKWMPNSHTFEMGIHENPVTFEMVLRRSLSIPDWHILKIDDNTRKQTVFGEMEERIPFPRQLVYGYCRDFAIKPWVGDTTKYQCGASRVLSSLELKQFVPGLTLIGVDPLYGSSPTHDRINSLPVLNMSLQIWEELSRPSDVNVMCAIPSQCALLQRSRRSIGIVEEDIPGEILGYHFEHMIMPFVLDDPKSLHNTLIYPPSSYEVGKEEVILSGSSRSDRYVLFLSREFQTTRSLPGEAGERFLQLLNETLRSSSSRLGLRVFRKRSGVEGKSGVDKDAQLFRGAAAVIGIHGGAFQNLIFCLPGTVVIEIHSINFEGRLQFTSMAYAQGHRYYAYIPSQGPWSVRLPHKVKVPGNDQYLNRTEMDWFNASDFHAFVRDALSASGLLA